MWGQSPSKGIEQINTYLRGWSGYFRFCTKENVYRLLRWDAHIRRRLRAILVQQKKRPLHLSRHLQQRGVSLRGATQAAYRRRGAWYQPNTYGMTAAYPNAWFHERLVSLASTWEALNPRPQLASGQTVLFDP
jgi:RNA-directed DNA polymerase